MMRVQTEMLKDYGDVVVEKMCELSELQDLQN